MSDGGEGRGGRWRDSGRLRHDDGMAHHDDRSLDADDGDPASRHLRADLLPRHENGVRRATRWVLNLTAGALLGDDTVGGSGLDLVVTRRDTGAEVLRTSAGGLEDADRLLVAVRRDLDERTVADFVREWRDVD